MNSYWEQRKFNEETALANMSEQKLNRKLAKEYLRLQREVIRDLENLYYKIQQEGGTGEALASHLYQYQGYYEQLSIIQQKLISMGSKEIEQIDSSLQQLYVANGSRITGQFNLPFNPPDVKAVTQKIWCNDKLHFSDRIWKQQNQLYNRINATLVDAVARGVNPDKLVENLMFEFGVSFHNAQRIVRTETSRIMVQSAADGYSEAGVDQFEVLADQSGVCEHCQEHHRQRITVNNMVIGVNAPPFHPNCRCTVLGVV